MSLATSPKRPWNAAHYSLCWSAIFFVASAAASSAYLTVSEVFPVEMRAIAISIFYALGTALGAAANDASTSVRPSRERPTWCGSLPDAPGCGSGSVLMTLP